MIRPYSLGKFLTILDAYVYDVSLDGCDETIPAVGEGNGWWGIMRHGRTIFRDHDPFLETLNEEERELLTSSAGVLIHENSQGFVYVDYCATEAELNRAWAAIQSDNPAEGETFDLD